jgi:hypothetical protein
MGIAHHAVYMFIMVVLVCSFDSPFCAQSASSIFGVASSKVEIPAKMHLSIVSGEVKCFFLCFQIFSSKLWKGAANAKK